MSDSMQNDAVPRAEGPAALACLAGETMIRTIGGPRPLEQLHPGDKVISYCCGVQTIAAITVVPAAEVPLANPIAIRFANGREQALSAASRILAATPWCELLFGIPEAMISADSLLGDPMVRPVTAPDRPYFALHLNRPDLIYTDNLLWMTPAARAVGADVLPFPQRLPRALLDREEALLLQRCARPMEKMLKQPFSSEVAIG